MRRTVYTEDHEDFRAMIRDFIEAEVVPVYDEWFDAGIAPRDFYYKLGELGLFGIEVPDEYGGAGIDSYKFQADHHRGDRHARRCPSAAPACTSALCLPYLQDVGHRGAEAALAPGVHHRRDHVRDRDDRAGHRLRPGRHAHHRKALRGRHALRPQRREDVHHRRRARRPGDRLCPHRRRRARTTAASASRCWSSTPSPTGYAVGRKLDKLGLRTSDTAELTFADVKVPAEDLLGEEHMGFSYLGQNLPRERLAIAVGAYAQAKAAVRVRRRSTPRTARSSASRSPRSRTPSSSWPPARPRSTRPRPSSTAPWRRTTPAS